MKTNQVFKLTITFVVLVIAGVSMAVAARSLLDAFDQLVLVCLGCALVGGSLAFYLNQMFNLDRIARE